MCEAKHNQVAAKLIHLQLIGDSQEGANQELKSNFDRNISPHLIAFSLMQIYNILHCAPTF